VSEIEFVDHSTVQLVKQNSSDLDVALAAWVSNNGSDNSGLPDDIRSSLWLLRQGSNRHGSEEDWKRIKGLINFLYRERHMSPFEHGSFTFFVDTPIFVAREFMRHRTWSYNETSGRYKKLEPRFYLVDPERPITQKGKVGSYTFDGGTDEQYGTIFAQSQIAYNKSWRAYEKMLDMDIAREVARNVLPVGTMTQFYATANPRNVMQFLQLRNDKNALHEIREVAVAIEEQFAAAMPITYEAYKKYDYREEKAELTELRKRVAQLEAEISYTELAPVQ
jgi:thymidylate synthase (FAD)